MNLTLPWPPSALSPNGRLHWARLAKAKAAYRRECFSATREQVGTPEQGGGALNIFLEFCPPTARRYDIDNLHARMKAGIDGACSALGIDDSRFDFTTLRILRPVKGGCVRIRIEESRAEAAS